jgi:tRNA-dihydrouridine synthase A
MHQKPQDSCLQKPIRRVCLAPMMDYTDRFNRYFLRLISRHMWLYTEMVTTQAILRGDHAYLLRYDVSEHPVALQLGGSDPRQLRECAKIGEDWGYDEINLNVGCPSERVSSGRFGACLMLEPELVADCVDSMQRSVAIPVTVKCRIGVDDNDRYEDLFRFVETVAQTGCNVFIVHARKAWLQGLSPKENREIPPLRYDEAYRLKSDFPHCTIVINGGITTLSVIDRHLQFVDGVMLGRITYQNPYLLAEVDRRYYGDDAPVLTRREIVEALLPFIERELADGTPLARITRHLLGLFQGVPGARQWKRFLSENVHKPGANQQLVLQALKQAGIE